MSYEDRELSPHKPPQSHLDYTWNLRRSQVFPGAEYFDLSGELVAFSCSLTWQKNVVCDMRYETREILAP